VAVAECGDANQARVKRAPSSALALLGALDFLASFPSEAHRRCRAWCAN
jgi:hypothetical protein